MEDIEKYAQTIGGNWSTKGQINTTINYLKDFFDGKLEVANIFISSWEEGNNYVLDTSLWIFTENLMLKCSNYRDIMSNGISNFEVYPLKGVSYSKVKYETFRSATVDIQLPNETIQFKAVGANIRYLADIYLKYIIKNI